MFLRWELRLLIWDFSNVCSVVNFLHGNDSTQMLICYTFIFIQLSVFLKFPLRLPLCPRDYRYSPFFENLLYATSLLPTELRGKLCLQCRRPGFDPWVGKIPGEGNGYPLQYSCLENPIDRGVWQATVHGVARVGYDLVTKPPPPRHFYERPTSTYFC